jgi:B-cell CLL/lymphoma protein 3
MYHRNHYADFDTINQHVQPFMDMPLDEGYGGMAVQDPPSPPSPSSLAIIIQQEEDRHALERTSVLPALTSKHSSYHCVDDDDHHKSMSVASVLPNSRLPLKKRRLHGDIDSGSFGGINNRMEGTITTTAVARHSTTNCTGRNLASNDEEAFHVALTADDDGDLPLHIAVVHEDIAVIRSLIRVMCMFGVSLDQYNKLKQTPLHLAVITGNVDTVRLLLNGGASPNVVDRDGLNSIHHAVQRSSISCLCCLLEESTSTPNVDAVTYNGLTALHLAVMRSDVDAIDVLLHAGAQVDATDGRNGRTALFYAVERNNMEVALVLLENGADARRTMYSNCSPAQAAVTARCSTELLQLLERYNNCTTFKSLLPCCATG